MKLKPESYKKITIAVFICVFAALAILAWCTPLAGDDYIYAFNDNSGVKPVRIIDIIWNIQIQRVTTSARFISHFFVELFIMKGKWMFNIVNAAVNTFALYILFSFAKSRTEKGVNLLLLLCGIFIIWLFMPVFGEVYLWLDGACNYAWGAALLLIFLYPFYRAYTDRGFAMKEWQKLLWLLAAPVFGAYSENGSAAGIIAAAALVILFLTGRGRAGKREARFLVPGLAFACAGYAFLVSSPVIADKGDVGGKTLMGTVRSFADKAAGAAERIGTPVIAAAAACLIIFAFAAFLVIRKRKGLGIFIGIICLAWLAGTVFLAVRAVRSAEISSVGNVAKKIMAEAGPLKAFLLAVVSEPAENLLSLCALYGGLVVSGAYYRVDPKKLAASVVFGLAGFASVAVFLLAIYRPARSCCYFTVLAAAACLIMLSELAGRADSRKLNAFGTALAAAFLIFFAVGVNDVASVKRQDTAIMDTIAAAQESGAKKVELPPYEYTTKYSALYGIDNIATEYCWLNHYMGMYYGFDELIGAAGEH